jgi:parallel beta-helix repeat protein
MFLDTVSVPYVFSNYFYVQTGAKLEIASNAMLKFVNGGGLEVQGTLIAKSALGDQTRFTAYTDDNVGGDTNADGSATVPLQSYWYGIIFTDTSVDSLCILKRARVTFAGYSNLGGVTMFNANPTIDSCSMAKNYYGVMMKGTSSPVFSNNDIGTSTVVPIALSFSANPLFSNNTFSASDNQYDAIGILSETVIANSYLPIRSVTSIPNVTYLMLGTVTIPPAYSLTIQPGVVIKSYNSYDRLIIQGKLVAQGKADSTIVFTSVHDDQYGNPHDTNKNGNLTNPGRGNWGGITFEGTSDTTSIIKYAVLRYGNTPPGTYYGTYPYGAFTQGLITLINASPTIENDTLTDNVYGVYALFVSKPKIKDCVFINSQYTPVAMSLSANPTFSGTNSMQNPGLRALGIIGHYVSANGNLYQRTFAGYTNITYVVLADVTIASGATVTVDPGVVVKMNPSTGIYVDGALNAKGNIANGRVYFTSIKDDNVGNPLDTNGDGLGTSPARGDWYTIRFQDSSVDTACVLDSTSVLYGGNGSYGAVTFTNASGSVKNSILAHSNYYGVKCEGNSAPLISDVVLQNNRYDPIAMSLLSNPTFQNITFDANGTKGIKILEGTLSSNATLNKRDVAGITNIAYIVDNLTINPGAVLTIAPGVVIKFIQYYGGISVQGGLKAEGTQSQRIIFTSLADDSNGGDTNNDGSSSSPNKGNWNSIDFANSSIDTVNSLKKCDFRYGGGYQYSSEYGLVRVYSSRVVIDSCRFTLGSTSGIGIFGSADPIITNTEITAVNLTPITMSMFANPTFSNNTFLNVGYAAIGIKEETYSQNATIPLRNFGGYNNITYMLWGVCTINSGTVITIPAGAVFKDGGFSVNGALKVLGTSGNPVVFTHNSDDSYGNPMDTNGNGNATSPSVNISYRIFYNDQSNDAEDTVKYAILRYATYAINLQQSAPTITNCTFSRDDWGILLNGVSGPTIDNCSFINLNNAPLLMSLAANYTATGTNVISGTTYRALGIVNETLAADASMSKRNFAGVNNIPYLVSGLTVGTSSNLTIEPGVVVKFRQYAQLRIQRGLLALGGPTADSTIVFTAETDDFYGGDTNADSTATTPFVGYWYGITFEDISSDPDCKIERAVIRYAGHSSQGALQMNSASPTIKFSSIRDNYTGIRATGASNPVINYCDIYRNTSYGIENVNLTFNINAQYNWWGSNTGPTHPSNPGGTGATITNMVDYANYLTSGAFQPLTGDVSLNGTIQAYDASLILKWLANSVANPLNSLQQKVADVSGTGGITALDASLILQYVVGKIGIFPIEVQSNPGRFLAKRSAPTGFINLASGSADRGQQVMVSITADGLSQMFAAGMEISFDKDVLTPTLVQTRGLADGKMMEYGIQEGKLKIFLASAEAIEGTGDLLTITFEAKKDLRGQIQSPVRFTELTLNESNALSQAREGFIAVKGMPLSFDMQQNYPNPFNPTTVITFDVPNDGERVRLEIYNITGQLVRILADKEFDGGHHQVTWDGTTDRGERLGSGIYFYRMKTATYVSVKKMILVK